MEPVPVTPQPSPGPSPVVQWTAVVVLVLTTLLAGVQKCIPDKVPEPSPDKVVVVPVDPAPKPLAVPESWIVLDKDGVRVTDSTVEKIAGSLKAGRWTAQGIPKPGEKGVSLTIVVDDGVVPVPPIVPPVVVPPVVTPPVEPPVVPPVTVKATSATYVYEKDSGGVPSAVMSGLNKVNRGSEFKILASVFEDDSTDGTGEVPEQYKAALKAAQDAGLPALVVTAGNVVLKVVKAPTTEQQVTEAVQ